MFWDELLTRVLQRRSKKELVTATRFGWIRDALQPVSDLLELFDSQFTNLQSNEEEFLQARTSVNL